MHELLNNFNSLIGSDPKELTILQVTIRAFIVYVTTVAMVRMGHKRFMGRTTAFDVILGIILGSVVSRGVNGQAAFLPTLFSCVVLVAIHYAFSYLSFHWKFFGTMVKGKTHVLIRDGEFIEEELRRNTITKSDVIGSMRLYGNVDNITQVKLATLENSGYISTVLREQENTPTQ